MKSLADALAEWLPPTRGVDSDAKTLPPAKFWRGYLHSYDGYAPAPTPAKAAPSRECPCGIFRGDCEYHR